LAEGLSLLRGVDARDANLVLFAVGVEDGDGVAVGVGEEGGAAEGEADVTDTCFGPISS